MGGRVSLTRPFTNASRSLPGGTISVGAFQMRYDAILEPLVTLHIIAPLVALFHFAIFEETIS
jgi:hypothetical protein